MSKLTQIALDFGEEPQLPPPAAADNGGGDGVAEPVRPYMTAGGVGVRVKSYKQPTPPAPESGRLFGDTASPEQVTGEDEPAMVIPAAMAAGAEPEPVAAEALAEVAAQAETVLAAAPMPVELPKRTPAAKPRASKPVKQTPSKRGRKSLKQVGAEADLIEIPGDEVLFSKQYYTMGEVSEMFRVNQSLLRFWETEFDILQPRKNKKGDRYFRPVDIKNLHLIYHLLRQKKYTIEGAKEFLKTNKKAEERFEVIQRLQQIKAFLLEWKAQL